MFKAFIESTSESKNRRFLGERVQYNNLWTDVVSPFIRENNFALSDGRIITRSWINPNDEKETYIDFGSWSTYIVIREE